MVSKVLFARLQQLKVSREMCYIELTLNTCSLQMVLICTDFILFYFTSFLQMIHHWQCYHANDFQQSAQARLKKIINVKTSLRLTRYLSQATRYLIFSHIKVAIYLATEQIRTLRRGEDAATAMMHEISLAKASAENAQAKVKKIRPWVMSDSLTTITRCSNAKFTCMSLSPTHAFASQTLTTSHAHELYLFLPR